MKKESVFQKHQRIMKDKIIGAYFLGWTITRIGMYYNVSNSTINRTLKGLRNRRKK